MIPDTWEYKNHQVTYFLWTIISYHRRTKHLNLIIPSSQSGNRTRPSKYYTCVHIIIYYGHTILRMILYLDSHSIKNATFKEEKFSQSGCKTYRTYMYMYLHGSYLKSKG